MNIDTPNCLLCDKPNDRPTIKLLVLQLKQSNLHVECMHTALIMYKSDSQPSTKCRYGLLYWRISMKTFN